MALVDTDAEHGASVAESIRKDVETQSLKRATGCGSGLPGTDYRKHRHVVCRFPLGAELSTRLPRRSGALRIQTCRP